MEFMLQILMLAEGFYSAQRCSCYTCGPSRRAQSPPKLTPPHLRTVTMTSRAHQKKAGVGACERNVCINVAEEKIRARVRARERNVCKHVCRTEKKASHKRGDLFFTLLNASHLKSH